MRRLTLRRVTLLGFLVAAFAIGPAIAAPSSLLYPAPENGKNMRARDVKVSVDGNPAFVYSLMRVGVTYGGIPTIASEFTAFELQGGAAQIAISYVGTPINSVRIRRLGAEIPFRRNKAQINFTVDKPGAYEIEVNHDLRNRGPLVIFANVPDTWNVRPDDIAFRPGRVTDAGVIHVTTNNRRIYIPGGAVVRALIKIDGASNVRIGGHGVLLFDDKSARDFENESDTSPILAIDTHGLVMTDVTVVVAPTSFSDGPDKGPVAPWAVHVLRSANTLITDLNIFNQLRDGLDIDGSEEVTIQGGFVQAHDDGLCIKSTNYGPGGGARDRPAKNIKFENIMVMNTGAGNALSIGKELHTLEIAHVTYRNLDILHAIGAHSTAIGIHNGDRANVHDITYDNILVNDQPGTLLHFSVETDGYRPDAIRGKIDNVVLRNLHVAEGVSAPSRISGIDPQHTVTGIRFENFQEGNNGRVGQALGIDIEKAPAPIWAQTRQHHGRP